jgi:uncharacterized membrane protein
MILYNTIVGLATAVALVLVAELIKELANRKKVPAEGFALAFGINGFILTVLGITISVTWPYTKVLHRQHYDGRACAGFWSIACRGLVLFMVQT